MFGVSEFMSTISLGIIWIFWYKVGGKARPVINVSHNKPFFLQVSIALQDAAGCFLLFAYTVQYWLTYYNKINQAYYR